MKDFVLFLLCIFKDKLLVSIKSLLLLLEEAEALNHLQRLLELDQERSQAIDVIVFDKLLDAADPVLESLDVLAHLVAIKQLLIEVD